MAALNSQAIRKHFVELTLAMLTPFAPYCEPTGPQPGEAPALHQQPPQLPAFSHADFIEQLQRQPHPPVLLQRFRSQASTYSLKKGLSVPSRPILMLLGLAKAALAETHFPVCLTLLLGHFLLQAQPLHDLA